MGARLSELQRELLRLAATAPPIKAPIYRKEGTDKGVAFDAEAFLTYYGCELKGALGRPEHYAKRADCELREEARFGILLGRAPFLEEEVRRAHRVAVTRALARLEQRGLIERFWYVSKFSRRRKGWRSAFSLTDEGRQVFASIKANGNR